MDNLIEDERWYTPWLDDPDFALQPIPIERDRDLYRRAHAPGPDVGPRLVMEAGALPTAPWWLATAGAALVNAEVRAIIESEARPGDLRWLDTRIVTPHGVSEDYSIPMPPGAEVDVLNEAATTRTAQGRLIRWVLDGSKIADRSVVWAPGVFRSGLSMRGRVFKRVFEAGVVNLPLGPTRVVPRQ